MRLPNFFSLTLGISAASLVASACATRQPLATKSVALAPPAATKAEQIGRAELWAAQCSRCHNLRARTEYSPAQWAVVLNHMRTVADLPGEDYRRLLEYLADRTPAVRRATPPIAAAPQADPTAGSRRSP